MSDRRLVFFLWSVFTAVALAASALPAALLYDAGLTAEREVLSNSVTTKAALIESIVRFHSASYCWDRPEAHSAPDVEWILEAVERFDGFGETGEFVLGIPDGDEIDLFVSRGAKDGPRRYRGNLRDAKALPMKLALQGQAGVVQGPDYAGRTVLAAYAPLPSLGMGLVSKLELAEVRRPFVRAVLLGTAGALVAIALGTVVLLRTLSALKATQRSHQAQEQMALLGRLTATISHDLRNPLGTVEFSLAALQQRLAQGDEAAARILARARANVGRCSALVEDLLEHNRGQAPRLETVVLDDWVSETLADYPWPQGVGCELNLASGRAEVRMDPARFRRVLVNLVRNACDATLEALREDGQPAAQVRVATSAEGDALLLTVRDEGPGLADPARLFEPMYSTKSMGVGLGLSIARKIVEAHAGSLALTNRTDRRGAEAVVSLPRGRG